MEAVDAFYYPDVMLVCDSEDRQPRYKTRPCLLAEVLSPTTENVDRREKFLAYRSIDSLTDYLIVDQDRRRVEHYRREGGQWVHEILEDEGLLALRCGDAFAVQVRIDELYEDVAMPPEHDAD